MANGLFSVQLYAVEHWEFINGSWVSPAEMKFDIAIHNFNFSNGGSDLALKTTLVSTTEYEIEHETDDEEAGDASNEEEVKTTTIGFTGSFSWTNTALIDGIEKQVKVSPLNTTGEDEILFLNYPRGVNIIHDPKIGISGILKMLADYTIIVILGIVAVVAVVLALFFKKSMSSGKILQKKHKVLCW
jgi:membrane-associated protease RseP (regulator of RpoE activity)